jgi:phosphate transport system ATP-binding protein
MLEPEPVVSVQGLKVSYGSKVALSGVSMDIHRNRVTTLIGPSGCGKSTFLRSLNRLNDRIPGVTIQGKVTLDGSDIYDRRADLISIRRKIGMVFQKPNPFPMSIYDNVALGARSHYGFKGKELDQVVEAALREAAIWDEVKDDYKRKSGLELSGGQQQRLCIARMLAVRPEVILMDEPCSALDPISTAKVEELIVSLRDNHTLVVVTHNLQQAERISDDAAFFMYGEIVESGDGQALFRDPQNPQTASYVAGRFG